MLFRKMRIKSRKNTKGVAHSYSGEGTRREKHEVKAVCVQSCVGLFAVYTTCINYRDK
jgi:hypothetical protein